MQHNILISIITVVYNGEQYLERTINSVLSQTYGNIEYLIIDGGSNDGTIDIIKKYEKRIDVWISEKDNGVYDAMNKGIGLAHGDLIGMINSDDWYENNAVELMVNAYIENSDKKIFHADRFDVQTDGSKKVYRYNPSKLKFLYLGNTFNHPSMFVTKDEYVRHTYNTNLKVYSDYQFILESYLRDRNVFYYLNVTIVNYRLDGLSGTMNLENRLKEGFLARKEAGMGILQNLLSLIIRFVKQIIY